VNSPSRRRGVVVALSLAGLALGAWTSEARAQAPTAPEPIVHLYVAADEPVVSALIERLRPRLAALGVDLAAIGTPAVAVDDVLATAPAVSEDAPLAQIWIDGRAPTNATLYLVPRRADRVLVRRVALGAGFDEVALAELVFIVERSVTAILASQPVGAPKDEVVASLKPPPVAVPVVARRTAPPRAREAAFSSLQVGVFCGAAAWAFDQVVVPDLGLVGGLERVRGARRVGVSADVQVRKSFVVNTVDGRVNVSGNVSHLLLTLGRSFGRHGTGRLLFGPGLASTDLHATPSIFGAQSTATPRADHDLMLTVLMRWDVPVADRVRVFVVGGFDVTPVPGRYTAVIDGQSRELLSPWAISPTLQVGFAFGGH
jgi:hypothetical protein